MDNELEHGLPRKQGDDGGLAEVVPKKNTLPASFLLLTPDPEREESGNVRGPYSEPREQQVPCGLMGWGEQLDWVWGESVQTNGMESWKLNETK